MAFLSIIELENIGFKALGVNVFISDKASIYCPQYIEIGNNVRIDDFCVISAGVGGVSIGSYIHIGVFSSLIGAGRITLSNFCNISSKVAIYSSNDDYSGDWMTNPMVPSKYTNVEHKDVFLGKHVIVGSGSVILPGVTLSEGVSIGSLSLVNHSCKEYSVYAGVPAKHIKNRSTGLKSFEILVGHDD